MYNDWYKAHMIMKKAQGYISSQPIDGIWVPQHIQNQIIRTWCLKNKLEYILSVAEYTFGECSQLKNILRTDADFIVMYTLRQLPVSMDIISEAVLYKAIAFASEDILCEDENDLNKINELIKLKQLFEN